MLFFMTILSFKRISLFTAVITFCLTKAYAIEFNTDLLDVNDKNNIDFSRFSQQGYIMPGRYNLSVLLNNNRISNYSYLINFFEEDGSEQTKACIIREIVEKFGLKNEALNKVSFQAEDSCVDFSGLPGVEIKPEMAENAINVSIPQIWLEYSYSSWLPPSRWDEGIAGVLVDYNINASLINSYRSGNSERLGYNGTAGINAGPWRLRADYRGNYNLFLSADDKRVTQHDFDWSRIYAYRALADWQSTLMLGENYTDSDIFDSWQFTGLSLKDDERMLPPKMRGYAPQVSGIAETNARVKVTQQGRILYDSTVPAGPFTIDSLDGSTRGRLDVEVIEQDGRTKKFRVDAAYVPYLTRPGRLRYKLSLGKPRVAEHKLEGSMFLSGEASWGINNEWSLYGGGITTKDFNTLSIGVAKDLKRFGSLSVDITQSVATVPENGTKKGKSWRVSYSKRFDEMNTDITFAGYRFSERDFMTMKQYLNARSSGTITRREKELYTTSVNKHISDWNMVLGLQYSHQTYWDSQASRYYNFSLNQYFDFFELKNISASINASRTQYRNRDLDSVYLSLSMPFGGSTLRYNSSLSGDIYEQSVGLSGRVKERLGSYSINAGYRDGNGIKPTSKFSGYYSRQFPATDFSANMSWEEKGYTSLGLALAGGVTATGEGVALHSGGSGGGTRLMVGTEGISGVPVDSGRAVTNAMGIAVVTSVNSYYRNTTTVDVTNMPDDIEVRQAVTESVLTEGAIGFQRFKAVKGRRLFATIRHKDGEDVPFGASVRNRADIEIGIVGEEGLTWLSGINPSEKIIARWGKNERCEISLPEQIGVDVQVFVCSPEKQ